MTRAGVPSTKTTQRERIAALAEVPLFSELSKRELERVARVAKEVTFPAGHAVTVEGKSGVGFHIILEGEVEVDVGGRTHTTLGPGSYLGEIALIDGGPRTATATAVTAVRALTILAWDFNAVLRDDPRLTHKILVELCRRLRELQQGGASVG